MAGRRLPGSPGDTYWGTATWTLAFTFTSQALLLGVVAIGCFCQDSAEEDRFNLRKFAEEYRDHMRRNPAGTPSVESGAYFQDWGAR